MAGDWIKMRVDLQTHPKVFRMASALNADKLRTIGGLHAAWCLFDVHATDGQIEGYTRDVLDAMIGWPGFAAAMVAVGWLEESGETLVAPRFDAHNGKSAKRRASESERKRIGRMSASDADKCPSETGTREEKRREEVKTPLSPAVDDEVEQDEDQDESPDLPRLAPVPHQEVIALYAKHLFALPQPKVWNDKRKKALKARWHSGIPPHPEHGPINSLSWWDGYFAYVATCPHLMGKNDRGWTADLEWLVNESNLLKVIEGKYSC